MISLMDVVETRQKEVKDAIHTHKSYMLQKIREEDWHGVADVAMDIREFDAELKTLRLITDVLHAK